MYHYCLLWKKNIVLLQVLDKLAYCKTKKMVSTRQSSNMGSSGSSGSVGEVEVNSLKKHHSVTAGTSNNGATIEPRNLNLLDLPVEILEKILGYLDFNMVAHMRLVSISKFKMFNLFLVIESI